MNCFNLKSIVSKFSLVFLICFSSLLNAQEKQPNFIIIFVDDLGYGDLSSFGNPTIKTPFLDKMASEGMKLTQFYVASPVCSPSRAAILTGAYPKRVGLEKHVLFPNSTTGLNPTEETIASLLKKKKYATACFGKWHLGHQKQFLPTNHGFDVFYGTPFSNDMSKKEQALIGNTNYKYKLPILSQTDTIAFEPDQENFTKMFTEKTISFIKKHKEEPFFVYLTHPMPHIPIYASKDFKGKSTRGSYGDTVEELDWSVGEILNTIKELELDKNTMVLFTSDNGPWKVYKTEGGSSGPLRGAKGTTWEGGQRVPCIVWWPGTIKEASIQTQVVTTMDILPTIAKITNSKRANTIIDGVDVSNILFEKEREQTARSFFYYSKNGLLEGVRKGAFKLLNNKEGSFLFNIEEDISESFNLIKDMPEKQKELTALMEAHTAEIEANKRQVGKINP